MNKIALAVSLLLALPGCWRARAHVNYDEARAFSHWPSEPFRQVASVEASAWVHYVGVCQEAASSAFAQIKRESESLGGNAIADVKWYVDGLPFVEPSCEAAFAIYWWGGRATVRATVIRVVPSVLDSPRGIALPEQTP